MILQQLYKDASDILGESLPPPMYDNKPVRWLVDLTTDGRLIDFVSLGGGKEAKRGIPHLVPYVGRTSGIRPILLTDSPAYVLGIARGDKEDKRAGDKHESFKALVKHGAKETGDPALGAVSKFLETWNPKTATIPAEITAADLVTFRVGGAWPVDGEVVQSYWAQSAKPEGEDDKGSSLQCLVSGLFGAVEDSLPGLIKRVPGGQSAGIALVSANAVAFESYGLERGQTSPISREAAERFTKALNYLIATPMKHITVGGLVYVFWTKDGQDGDFYSLIDKPEPEQVKKLLDAQRTGRPFTEFDDEKFHVFALSASGGRAVVRDTLNTTVGEARANLARWFAAQDIVDAFGQKTRYFGLYPLAACAYRDANKEMAPQTPRLLLRSALHGDPLPALLRDKIVLRCRVTHQVTHAQAALLKAILTMNPNGYDEKEAIHMTALDAENSDPAYRCGRLLAELEVVQRQSLGETNTTLIDRYFGAASTTPAAVFGTLLTNANKAHLPKLRKTRPGVFNALQKRLEDILFQPVPMTEFPKTLTLEQQGRFVLGYYHQRAKDRAAAMEAKQKKLEGKATEDESADAEIEIGASTTETEDN